MPSAILPKTLKPTLRTSKRTEGKLTGSMTVAASERIMRRHGLRPIMDKERKKFTPRIKA